MNINLKNATGKTDYTILKIYPEFMLKSKRIISSFLMGLFAFLELFPFAFGLTPFILGLTSFKVFLDSDFFFNLGVSLFGG